MKAIKTIKTKLIIIAVISSIGFYKVYSWYNKPAYIKENNIKIGDLLSDSEIIRMEKAVKKMGPRYQYIIEPNGVLKVKLNNKWYVLKY